MRAHEKERSRNLKCLVGSFNSRGKIPKCKPANGNYDAWSIPFCCRARTLVVARDKGNSLNRERTIFQRENWRKEFNARGENEKRDESRRILSRTRLNCIAAFVCLAKERHPSLIIGHAIKKLMTIMPILWNRERMASPSRHDA